MALLMVLLAVGGIAASPYPPDPDCQSAGLGSPIEINECRAAQMAVWEQRLNAEYQTALKRADAPQRSPLQAAQRLWVKYRDANCFMYSQVEGSISRTLASHCELDMTRQRTIELHEMDWTG